MCGLKLALLQPSRSVKRVLFYAWTIVELLGVQRKASIHRRIDCVIKTLQGQVLLIPDQGKMISKYDISLGLMYFGPTCAHFLLDGLPSQAPVSPEMD